MHEIGHVPPNALARKQEAVRVSCLVVIAQRDQEGLERQKQHFLARGYQVSETGHFVVCLKPPSQQTVLLHMFGQATINADLICFIENELTAWNFISTARDFGAVLFAVLASTFPAPRHQPTIWRQFCVNTLTALRSQIAHPPLKPTQEVSYIAPFAAIYRRVFELFRGSSLLDIGCSFGFLPVLMAEHVPGASILGCDNNPDAIAFASDVATAVGTQQVTFALHDLLAPSILDVGTFDTVTAVHLLEHLPEPQLAQAFAHLLQLTRARLMVAVPYEEQICTVYGHEQLFSREKLEQWGRWCVERCDGAARYRCEDVAGGLLIVDRLSGKE